MSKESFVLYKSFYEPIRSFTVAEKGILFESIFEYQLTGEDPKLEGKVMMAFLFFKNQFNLDDAKYLKTCEKNKDNADKRWRIKSCDSMPSHAMDKKHADNDNDNDKDKDKDIIPPISPKGELILSAEEVLSYLNTTAKKNFKILDSNLKPIMARLNEKYTVEECKSVIDVKTKKWMGTDFEIYLRPETLFGKTKFQSYVQEVAPKKQIITQSDDPCAPNYVPKPVTSW